jgi:hypothetical protein
MLNHQKAAVAVAGTFVAAGAPDIEGRAASPANPPTP